MVFGRDFIVYENSELIKIEFNLYKKLLNSYHRNDTNFVNRETIDKAKNLFNV